MRTSPTLRNHEPRRGSRRAQKSAKMYFWAVERLQSGWTRKVVFRHLQANGFAHLNPGLADIAADCARQSRKDINQEAQLTIDD